MEALQEDEYDGYIAEFSRNIAFLDDTDNDIVDNINETDDNINENDDNINETEEIEDKTQLIKVVPHNKFEILY
ncbi:hypothetical protein RhiirB3_447727 [Rhizophagus irregularis]|nr:hypothetical protein RhiirB3_447727 [Rhizophagus irregularis]